MRFDIISDTHGHLSGELLSELEGANIIVHAGDICLREDLERLEQIAPVYACAGNNDWGIDLGPYVKRLTRFYSQGLRFEICHYRERLDLLTCDVGVCGHTHRPYIERDQRTGTLVINPGSPTYPRSKEGPTMVRLIASAGVISSAEIVHLGRDF